jgi:hypothetical protein
MANEHPAAVPMEDLRYGESVRRRLSNVAGFGRGLQ